MVDYQYNELNQLTKKKEGSESYSYTYDKRGNRTAEIGKKASRSYQYDETNRMVEGSNWKGDKSAYTYNGLGLRMFTRGSQRLIVRGGMNNVNIDGVRAQELASAGYKWSGHTHPGIGDWVKTPSPGDRFILNSFKQNQSAIYDGTGKFELFGGL